MSKRILDCFSFALFRSVIGLENSHLSLNQSNADTKNQSHLGQSRFPALPPGCMFLISHWIVMMLTFFFLTGGFDYFGYVGRQSLITVLFHSMSCPRKCLEEMRNDTSILYDYLPVLNL